MKFDNLYEDIFKPATPEELEKRKQLSKIEDFKEWCDKNGVNYTEDNKGNIVSFDKDTINNKARHGYTALLYASWWDLVPMVRLLLRDGANVNSKTNNWHTALYYVKLHNNKELVDLLKRYGAKE